MKTKTSIFALICFIFLSCEKENTSSDKNTLLSGKWNWVMSSGGIAGETITPTSSGFRFSIEFTADSTYRFYRNDSLKSETKYHLIKSKTIYSQDTVRVIKYDNRSIIQSYLMITPDTLLLLDECLDCYTSKYARIKK